MLVYCRECEHQVSGKAGTCPNCGHPLTPTTPSSRVKLLIVAVNSVAVLGGLTLYFLLSKPTLDSQQAEDLIFGKTIRTYLDSAYRERIRSISVTLNQRPTPGQLDAAVPIAKAIVTADYATFEEACFTLAVDLPMVLNPKLTASDWLARADYAKTISIGDALKEARLTLERKVADATSAKEKSERLAERFAREGEDARRRLHELRNEAARAASVRQTPQKPRRTRIAKPPPAVVRTEPKRFGPYEVAIRATRAGSGPCGWSSTFTDAIRDADRAEVDCRNKPSESCLAAISSSQRVREPILLRFERPTTSIAASGDLIIRGPVRARTQPDEFYLTANERLQRTHVKRGLVLARMDLAAASTKAKEQKARYFAQQRATKPRRNKPPKSGDVMRFGSLLREAEENSRRYESAVAEKIKNRRREYDYVTVAMYVSSTHFAGQETEKILGASRIEAVALIDALGFDDFDSDEIFGRAIRTARLSACRPVVTKP